VEKTLRLVDSQCQELCQLCVILTVSEANGGLERSEGLSTLQHCGNFMYRQFNIQTFYVLPTQCIYVFCKDLRTNSN